MDLDEDVDDDDDEEEEEEDDDDDDYYGGGGDDGYFMLFLCFCPFLLSFVSSLTIQGVWGSWRASPLRPLR